VIPNVFQFITVADLQAALNQADPNHAAALAKLEADAAFAQSVVGKISPAVAAVQALIVQLQQIAAAFNKTVPPQTG
jgi:uncharacterized coiled-coil protein SlyX